MKPQSKQPKRIILKMMINPYLNPVKDILIKVIKD
jgi:hypothetical protein